MIVDLGFKEACQNFCNAGYQVVRAAWIAPFNGGWKRMVTLGPPVFLVSCGICALIYHLMLSLIKEAAKSLYRGAKKLREDFFPHRITVIQQPSFQQEERKPVPRLNRIKKQEVIPSIKEKVIKTGEIVFQSHPVEAVKERNASLLTSLELINEHFITPKILKNTNFLEKAKDSDPFFKAMIEDQEEFKRWISSIVLWQLGLIWDKLEKEYVKRNTPEPPTLQSLARSIEQMKFDKELENLLIEAIPVENNKVEIEKKIQHFQNIINNAELTNQKKIELFVISLQLGFILKNDPMEEKDKVEQINGMRKRFAITMNDGIINSLKYMPKILEGWLSVIEKNSYPKKERPLLDNVIVFPKIENHKEDPFQLEALVTKVSETVIKILSDDYLKPLWEQQTRKMRFIVFKEFEMERIENINQEGIFCENFIAGKLTENEFLNNSTKYSTSLISRVALIRTISCMENKKQGLHDSFVSIPQSLAAHLQPLIVNILQKAALMLSQISFQRTVPIVVDYFIELLNCCQAMQKVRTKKVDIERKSIENDLVAGKINQEIAKQIDEAYKKTPYRVTGRELIEELGNTAHKTLRLGRTFAKIQERTWIDVTKNRIKGLLQKCTAQLAEKETIHWLFSLLKSSEGVPTNLVSALLSQQQKIWQVFPGMESIVEIVFLGFQTFAEEKGIDAIQKHLDKLTSTGYLSNIIGRNLVKKLIDSSKDNWKENLATLQQAFAFLTKEEREKVLKHFCFQSLQEEVRLQREKELIQTPISQVSTNIRKMIKEENRLKKNLHQIEVALNNLEEQHENNAEAIDNLKQAQAVIKQNMELKQFERIKGLILYVADNTLAKKLKLESLKEIVLAVIHESFSLISYQEVVKHWIFTMTDLLLDELEEAIETFNSIEKKEEKETNESLIYFIQEEQKNELLQKLVSLMKTSTEEDKGLFNTKAWVKWGVSQATNWLPGTIWDWIQKELKKPLTITPAELTKSIIKSLEEYGTDPSGLATSLVEGLNEFVIDSRKKILL